MQSETTQKPRRPKKERPQRDGMVGAARQLRSNPTEAETMLWEALRRKQVGGMRFRRQRVIGPYIVDFCCLSHKLVVEVDGAHHHNEEYREYDEDRTSYLEANGFQVLRFNNVEVLTDIESVVARINWGDGCGGTNPSLPTSLPSAEGKEERGPVAEAPLTRARGSG
jgi:very-short-patch-repair endonuclease